MASVPSVTTSVTIHPVFLDRKREKQKERETKRERDRKRERQKERETERERDRKREKDR